MNSMVRGLAATLCVSLCALTLSLLSPTGASAAGQDGAANAGEMIFSYNSSTYRAQYGPSGPRGYGSQSDFAAAKKDLAGYVFLTAGNGRGTAVKNNAARAWNRNTDFIYGFVYYNSYNVMGCWCGTNDIIPSQTEEDLQLTKNDNASFRWALTRCGGAGRTC